MYTAAREWGMQPSEFWSLSPIEFWWEFDAKVKVQKRLEKQSSPAGKFTEAEWEAARQKFREMENGNATDRPSR
jgi:hypothetical protein